MVDRLLYDMSASLLGKDVATQCGVSTSTHAWWSNAAFFFHTRETGFDHAVLLLVRILVLSDTLKKCI